jgi:hypothetical protein
MLLGGNTLAVQLSVILPSTHASIYHARSLAQSRFGNFVRSTRMPMHAANRTVEVRPLGNVPFCPASAGSLLADGPATELRRSAHRTRSGSDDEPGLPDFDDGKPSATSGQLFNSCSKPILPRISLWRNRGSQRKLPRVPEIIGGTRS